MTSNEFTWLARVVDSCGVPGNAALDAANTPIEPEPELIGYEEHLRDEGTHADYVREAYGDPCPGCGTPRYGGDCGKCYDFDAEAADAELARHQFDTNEEKEGDR